jgi:hypothetical protein
MPSVKPDMISTFTFGTFECDPCRQFNPELFLEVGPVFYKCFVFVVVVFGPHGFLLLIVSFILTASSTVSLLDSQIRHNTKWQRDPDRVACTRLALPEVVELNWKMIQGNFQFVCSYENLQRRLIGLDLRRDKFESSYYCPQIHGVLRSLERSDDGKAGVRRLFPVKPIGMRCPRCGATAVSKIHRTFLERVLTFLTAYRKWGCDPCGYHWLGRTRSGGSKKSS